jgi:hypothetical protein
MSEEDRLFNFMFGFKPWAQTKLRRQNIKNLSSVIIVSESLVDFKSTTREGYTSTSFKSREKDKEEKKRKKKKKFDGGASKAVMDKGKAKLMGAQGKGTKSNFTSFICDSPYFTKKCPKRKKLNVIRVRDSDGNEGVVTQVNPICVLRLVD